MSIFFPYLMGDNFPCGFLNSILVKNKSQFKNFPKPQEYRNNNLKGFLFDGEKRRIGKKYFYLGGLFDVRDNKRGEDQKEAAFR